MKFFVGVTDNDWYRTVSSIPDIDEVNFWRPSDKSPFRALSPGEIFLFKLHSPLDYIVGGGIFTYFTTLPCSVAWDAFEVNNGASSFQEMRRRIVKYRRSHDDGYEDFKIGCILLEQPFFLDRSDWFAPPDWKLNIVSGKHYKIEDESGQYIWKNIQNALAKQHVISHPSSSITENPALRYGKETLIKPRLGQGAFKVLVTDAYQRACAITREKALPVLEAAHIKPYGENGPHSVKNGLLLRSDVHKLFDRGYITITTDSHVEVSRRIKEEFHNGEHYYRLHGNRIQMPENALDNPSHEYLTYHNENVFKG